MNNIEILERHFNAFIGLEDTHNFFLGMVDYLDFLDATPEFEHILKEIIGERKVLETKKEELGNSLILVLDKIKKQFEQYIATNNIQNELINKALNEYQGWKMEKIVGSNTIPNALHGNLCEVIYELKKSPEHIEFIKPFCQFINNDPNNYIQRALSFPEYNDYYEIHEEIQHGAEATLWGQLDHLSILYQMIKNGKKKMKELIELHKTKPSTKISWEMMNLSVLISEWKEIEQGRTNNAYFYKIERVKPWLVRLHNQVITRAFITAPKITENQPVSNFSYNINTGDGQFKGKDFRLKEATNYRKIFDTAFIERGKKITKEKIIEILGLTINDEDSTTLMNVLGAFGDSKPRKKSFTDVAITATINEEVKTIRNKTGLNNKQFVNNGGNLILNI